jgi:hypothetical protein
VSVYGAVNRAARSLARRNRGQVRIPTDSMKLGCRQAVVQSVNATHHTCTVVLANSATPFTAAWSDHYHPAVNDTCWVMFFGTSPMVIFQCQ